MTAIDLNILRQQVDTLASHLEDPQTFIKEFHELMETYHQRFRKRNRENLPKSFLRTYDLPIQVFPILETGLKSYAQKNPEPAIVLIEKLRKDPYFEAQDLAAFLLGVLPETISPSKVEITINWLKEPVDNAVVESIFNRVTGNLNLTANTEWKFLIRHLLESNDPRMQNLGLKGLAVIIEKHDDADLPFLFKQIRPFIQTAEQMQNNNLRKVISVLAERTPYETAYLLKQILADREGKEIERQIRSYFDFFPEDIVESLKTAIKSHAYLNR